MQPRITPSAPSCCAQLDPAPPPQRGPRRACRTRSSVEPSGRGQLLRRPPRPAPQMARSREVKIATTFSSVTSSARRQLHADVVPDPAALADDLPHHLGRTRSKDPRPRGLGHPDARLRGLHHEQDRLVVEALAAHGRKVRPCQVAVAGHARVADRAVQPGADRQPAGPVLGRHRGLQRRDVGPVHRHQPALGDPRGAAGGIAQAGMPLEDALAQVQLLPVLQDLVASQVQPGPAVDPQGGDQPVGQVDQALVHDPLAVDDVREAVVGPGHVGPGVVRTVGGGLRHRPAGGQVAVAQRAQALAPPLLPGHETLQPVGPGTHR